MYKGKAVLTIEIDMNIPEDTDGILPLDQIQENVVKLDEIFQQFMDEEVLCPEDGITGQAILEEAYIDYADEEGSNEDSSGE